MASRAVSEGPGGLREAYVAGKRWRRPRHLLPLSLRTSLALVLLVPIAVTMVFAITMASATWSNRQHAVDARNGSRVLDTLVEARTAVDEEYVATAAIVSGTAHHVSVRELDLLLGIDVESDLVVARRAVDNLAILRTSPSLSSLLPALYDVRRSEEKGTASFGTVEAYFGKLVAAIDALSSRAFVSLSKQADGNVGAAVAASVDAFNATYRAFRYGAQQVGLADAILISPSTPGQAESLIAVTQQLQSAVAGFPQELGPRARKAWMAIGQSVPDRQFSASVQLAIQAGLRGQAPPFANNLKANAGALRAELVYFTSLTALVSAASADLRAVTLSEEGSATTVFAGLLIGATALLALEIGAAVALTRAVRRRLARLVSVASSVNSGDFDVSPLDEHGPKELAVAAKAFNAMAATLQAVEEQVAALSTTALDLDILSEPLPGRMGTALQAALDRLQGSMRADEETRSLLHDRAIHDSLTGLLNRGAAVEALEQALARARSRRQALTLLFIDLDGLKVINDSFGHEGGDAAIRAVADALVATTREADIVARFGGDEFVLAWLQSPDGTGAPKMAERVRKRVAASRVEVRGKQIAVSCSIGVAVSGPTDDSVDSLIHRADEALYKAKTEGGDRVQPVRSDVAKSRPVVSTRRSSRHGIPVHPTWDRRR